jgi:hypothetical protein
MRGCAAAVAAWAAWEAAHVAMTVAACVALWRLVEGVAPDLEVSDAPDCPATAR